MPVETVHYAARNQPLTAPAAPYLQRYSADTLKFARDALQQDRAQGARQAERFSGAGNIPAYWHVAYSAGLPFSEMAALIDEYLDQLAYFDGVFAGI